LVSASIIIATNNPDALPLPADDRRFAVLTNGERREQEFWDRINSWMSNSANVAAFAHWLEQFNLGDYSPYAVPPRGVAKTEMVELSKTDIDRAFEEALAVLPGEVLLPEQVINAMSELARVNRFDFPPDRWKAIARRLVQRHLHKIGEQDGPNYKVKFGGRKHRTYARTKALAEQWLISGDIRSEILKNGDPNAEAVPAELLGRLKLVVDNTGPGTKASVPGQASDPEASQDDVPMSPQQPGPIK
jgi:hypothetical protein